MFMPASFNRGRPKATSLPSFPFLPLPSLSFLFPIHNSCGTYRFLVTNTLLHLFPLQLLAISLLLRPTSFLFMPPVAPLKTGIASSDHELLLRGHPARGKEGHVLFDTGAS